MNYFTNNHDTSCESGGISIPKRGITAIAIAIVMGIAGLSLVGCPDNTGDGTDTGVDTTAPAQVTGLAQMRSVDSTSVTLSWTNPADTDLETIRITVDPALPDFPLDVPASGASMSQSEVVTGLDATEDYTFAVLTIDAAENVSSSSTAPTVTASGDTTAPAQITGLAQMRSVDSTSVTLSWTNPADIDLETVRITVDPALPDFPLDVEANGASMEQSEVVTGLDATEDYVFTVRTVDAAENVSSSSTAPTVTALAVPDTTAPGQVTSAMTSASADSVTLSWTNPTDADLSHISIAWTPDTSGPMQPIETARTTPVATTQLIADLTASTAYTFTLVAVDTSGNVSSPSAALTVSTLRDTTAPGQVTGASGVASADSVTLSWTNPTDADLSHISIAWTPDTSGPMQPIETARTTPVATTQIITGLAASTPHTFTIRTVDTTGNVSALSSAATTDATTGVLEFTAVGAGNAHTCALRGGTVSCWGFRSRGRLGIGGAVTGNQPTPVAVSLAGVSAIAVADTHTCAIAGATDAAHCWGDDTNEQLGNGAATGNQPSPVAVLSGDAGSEINLTNVSAISTGFSHTCAIVGDTNAAYCWGGDANGQLGNGAPTGTQASPVAVLSGDAGSETNLTGVSAISAGAAHTCAIAGDTNAAYCWGNDNSEQIGNGATTGDQTTPVAVMGPAGTTGPLIGVTAIVAGAQHTCAIAGDTNAAYCWGLGANGRLGSNTTANQSRPVLVVAEGETGTLPASGADSRTPLAAVTSLSIDGDTNLSSPHSCAVAGTTNIAYCWGTRSDALGIRASTADQMRPAAVQGVGGVGMLIGIVAISAGSEHTCAISPDAAYCWGGDINGQLGNGATVTASQSSPVDITGFF